MKPSLDHEPLAAVAHANGLALYTRNAKDLTGLEDLVDVRSI